MSDYDCYPLWSSTSEGTFNTDPATLPLPEDLVRDLIDWSVRYDETLNSDDPLSSGFATAQAEEQFAIDGLALAQRLAQALPDDEIRYFDSRVRADYAVPLGSGS
ncbi:hypothetical protein [Actinoplanes sp. CA-252034]|uniref:hypothetical protein n=1 Tax=Actinoplanes sp. CA-252034 TaxID=3239906 RepID=UPI003D985D77